MPGLSDQDAEALTQFAAKIHAGVNAAGPAERRRIYEYCGGVGEFGKTPSMASKGRDRRFSVEWQAVFELRHSGRPSLRPLTTKSTAEKSFRPWPARDVAPYSSWA